MTTIVIVLFALFIITTVVLGVVDYYYDVDAMMAASRGAALPPAWERRTALPGSIGEDFSTARDTFRSACRTARCLWSRLGRRSR